LAQVTANGLQFEVERYGNPQDPAVLLIMGLGMQLVSWPMAFCQSIVDAGYQVVRFDNRDIGLSQRIDARHMSLQRAALRHFLRMPVPAPYTIESMAEDTIAIMDALGIAKAHLVGASMGGMIAQTVAAKYPQRCLSLVSIMSTSGDRKLPNASWRVSSLMLARPPRDAPMDQLVEHYVKLFKVIGSPGFPTPPEHLRERMRNNLTRSYDPRGTGRQLLAVVSSGDRSASLKLIKAPTLVIHGDADPLVPVAHGVDTAQKIAGAKLQIVPGMGHDFAPGLLPILSTAILAHIGSSKVDLAA